MTSLEYAYARQHSHGFQKMKACKYGANLKALYSLSYGTWASCWDETVHNRGECT